MMTELPVLENLRVASPCSASWDEMRGDDRARFCGHCSKNVYNLSDMTRSEAEALVREKEGRLCVRFYQRRDGTVLTQDCPVGHSRLRRALVAQVGLIAAVFLAIPGLAGVLRRTRWREWALWDREPYHSAAVKLGIRESSFTMVMGDIAMPPPPPPTTRGSGIRQGRVR